MFNGDRLNDDYEIHQRRVDHKRQDELEILVSEAKVYRPRWYNGILAQVGEGLISVGSALKEHNSSVKSNNLSTSGRKYETFSQ
jgi:hypothetical protein